MSQGGSKEHGSNFFNRVGGRTLSFETEAAKQASSADPGQLWGNRSAGDGLHDGETARRPGFLSPF